MYSSVQTLGQDARIADTHTLLWTSIALGAAVALAVCVLAASKLLTIGSVAGGWHYGYSGSFSVRMALVFLVASIAAIALLFVPTPSTRAGFWSTVLLWIAIATALHAVVRSLGPFTLEQLFLSPGANGFYTVATDHEPMELLGRFHSVRQQGPLHAMSNMPGKTFLVYALRAITHRTDLLPWLLVLISNLGAALMYVFVRNLFDDRRVALFAAVLYLFVPGRVLFMPLMNTITPVVVLGCGCVLFRWLRTGNTLYPFLMGAALFVLTFFEPLPLVMGLLFAAVAVRAIAIGQISWDRFAAQTVLMVLVFVLSAEAMSATTGFSLFAAFRSIGGHAIEFNEVAGRPYRIWIGANLREFLFGTGACQAIVFAGSLVYSFRGPEPLSRRLTRPLAVVCTSLLAVLIALDLGGVNRGEVTRLWIFLGCFFQIPIAYVCAALGGRLPMAITIGCSLLQTVLGAGTIEFIVP
jgi:hypothetical protein